MPAARATAASSAAFGTHQPIAVLQHAAGAHAGHAEVDAIGVVAESVAHQVIRARRRVPAHCRAVRAARTRSRPGGRCRSAPSAPGWPGWGCLVHRVAPAPTIRGPAHGRLQGLRAARPAHRGELHNRPGCKPLQEIAHALLRDRRRRAGGGPQRLRPPHRRADRRRDRRARTAMSAPAPCSARRLRPHRAGSADANVQDSLRHPRLSRSRTPWSKKTVTSGTARCSTPAWSGAAPWWASLPWSWTKPRSGNRRRWRPAPSFQSECAWPPRSLVAGIPAKVAAHACGTQEVAWNGEATRAYHELTSRCLESLRETQPLPAGRPGPPAPATLEGGRPDRRPEIAECGKLKIARFYP